MIVDAKRKVPWTKPEEVEVSLKSGMPLPKLGGIFEGVFVAGFADGSVRELPDSIDAGKLRGLFSVAGREVIDLDAISKQQPIGK
jgi:hypothetical protein